MLSICVEPVESQHDSLSIYISWTCGREERQVVSCGWICLMAWRASVSYVIVFAYVESKTFLINIAGNVSAHIAACACRVFPSLPSRLDGSRRANGRKTAGFYRVKTPARFTSLSHTHARYRLTPTTGVVAACSRNTVQLCLWSFMMPEAVLCQGSLYEM